MLEDSSSEWRMGEGKQADLEYSYRARVHVSEFQPLCSKFGAENPQVLHIPGQQFSTKDQNEKIRMAAAEQKREVATAEPLLAGLLYPA